MFLFLPAHLEQVIFQARAGREDAAQFVKIICQNRLQQNPTVLEGDSELGSSTKTKGIHGFRRKRDAAGGFKGYDLNFHGVMVLQTPRSQAGCMAGCISGVVTCCMRERAFMWAGTVTCSSSRMVGATDSSATRCWEDLGGKC